MIKIGEKGFDLDLPWNVRVGWKNGESFRGKHSKGPVNRKKRVYCDVIAFFISRYQKRPEEVLF